MPDLIAIGEETITVSSTAIGPEDGTAFANAVEYAIFQHRSGGKIYHNIISDPVAGGGAGDIPGYVGDIWTIKGHDHIKNFDMIKQTSESDATVVAQYFGTRL
tara:strand:+ start:64 stop:372 length:309 start_codon:yes stop_codon:yes gene_type:complete